MDAGKMVQRARQRLAVLSRMGCEDGDRWLTNLSTEEIRDLVALDETVVT